jgi:carboxypeptidase PM20D1
LLVLWIILGLIAAFLAVILVRAALFRPKKTAEPPKVEAEFDRERSIEALRTLIRCKTVSRYDHALEDDAEFEKLIGNLSQLYPSILSQAPILRLPDRGLLLRWEGKKHGAPTVLMAHYDVVPVEGQDWEKPPFDAVLEDGVLWGRGSLDTKVTFNGILSAADTLAAKGWTPENDIYLAFSGGEEVSGPGAARIVEYFKKNRIQPALVVDEGGAVVQNVFPGVREPCAVIGIAEKGLMDLEYRVVSGGGHASAPPPHTPVGILAAACARVENHPFPMHLTKPAREMFDTLGRRASFGLRIVFANLWCFGPVLNAMCKKSGGELNALLRTTVAFTQMEGSKASNVLPPEASMVSNIRLNPADTMDSAVARIRRTIGDDRIELVKLRGMDPSPISETACPAWDKVAAAVAGTWPGSLVSPYLMVQCADARHYRDLSDHVYRFSAMDLTLAERKTIHGSNERIRVETAGRAVEFYLRLIQQC